MTEELPFFGLCPHETLFDAVLEFELQFTWNNWIERGQFYRQVLTSPLLRAGYWNFWFTQISPAAWTAHRPTFDSIWVLGNYKIDGTGLSNSLVNIADPLSLDTEATSGFEYGPIQAPVGTFTLGIGNVLIETIPPCGCSARDAGADTIDFIIEKDLDLALSDLQSRGVPESARIKIRGARQ